MHTKIDFTEGSSSEHFAGAIKFILSLGSVTSLFKGFLQFIADFDHFNNTGGYSVFSFI
jgi:hypothetical protein